MLFGIDFSKFISLEFWFETRPGGLSPRFELMFLIIVITCYVLYGVTVFLVRRNTKKKNFTVARFWEKVRTLFITLAIVISFVFFFRYEAIPILGGRFWFLFWALGGIAWAVYLIYFYIKVLPKKLKDMAETKNYKKYLPKKKKK